MDCLEARAALSPEEALRLATPRVLEARRHVDRCVACREAFRVDHDLQERLRALGRIQAPADVRERVFDAVARVRAGRSGRWGREVRHGGAARVLVGLAAVVLVTTLGLAFGLGLLHDGFTISSVHTASPEAAGPAPPSAPGPAPGSAFVEDFLRRAVQAEHIQTSDPGEVARFLARELGILGYTGFILPPADLDLQGAEVCIVDGVRGAVVVYRKEGRVLYHYLIPRPGAEPRAPVALGMASGLGPSAFDATELPRVGSPGGGAHAGTDPALGSYPSVVTWASEGMEEALVGDLPVASLLDVAGPRAP